MPKNRPTENAAVRAVQAIFENGNLPFQEVELRNDLGKDAYVDLAEDGVHRGDMVALQIKGGLSYRDGDDYKVPCTPNDRAVWRGSSIPIYGMVHDPESDEVHWADLSTWARALPVDTTASYCPVPRDNRLDKYSLGGWAARVRRQLRAQVDPPVLNLASKDLRKQGAAIYDCFALGRRDARALLLLRASLRWLADVDSTWPAIQVLSLATHHPDVMWTDENWLPEEVRAELRDSFRWTVDEAETLIEAPTGDMWDRGDLGQCVYELLTCDPRCERILEAVVATTGRDEVRFQAARIRVALAEEEGLEVLDRLAAGTPTLAADEMFGELRGILVEHQSAALY
jgi:hypothetical protein